jgi:HNH endonuclease.
MTGDSNPRVDAKERDEHICQKCGHTEDEETDMKAHYIVPLDVGGAESVDNVATLCPPCYRYAPERVS